jgi:2-phosphoglycolate phosphatase
MLLHKEVRMEHQIDAILFDLDGTLLDTARDLLHCINLTLKEYDKLPSTYDVFRQHISGGIASMVTNSFDVDTEHEDFETIKKKCLNHYQNNLATHTIFFEGIEAVLDHLDEKQIPWGIVTNKSTRFTLPILEMFGLDNRIKCMVAADTLEHMKPHPAPMLHACKLLQQDPKNTLYIGDFETDIQAGRAAGMPCMAVTYGYYPANVNPHDWQADITVDHPDEILAHLTTLIRR